MNMSKRIQAFWLAVIMAFLPCCTAFAEAMPGVATGNDLPAITEELPTPTEAAEEAPIPTEQPTSAAEDETAPPIETAETQTTEEPTVTPPAPLPAQAGDFVSVTTSTRVFLGVDDTLGALSLGVFVRDAVVQVDVVEQDTVGRAWYRVRYLYGDDYANGTLKWTAEGLVYVLAEETQATDAQALTVTDYAFEVRPAGASRAHRASAMDGFTLKNIHGTIGSFTVGQTGVHGSSGKDSEYKQIATLPGKGAIYATPHYLNGCPVYCLEHMYPGPGENISGGGKQPTGPYTIVDIDSYMSTPGNSKMIYHQSTLHAIAWVLRHTYPFMVLDRSDASNETWSRVAGQFAIREVIKQLEGAQYVRDYWRMNEFYAAANQAPAVYLTYARWLAANGIARASITGEITVTGQSVQQVGNQYIGKITLTTDADLMRIRKTAGGLTGNTAGADDTYYYLNSGDMVQITSSSNGFAVQIESVSSDTEEADFLIGVPDAAIQKVLIPMQGKPYAMKSKNVAFEYVIQYGDLTVQKQGKGGKALSGATFQLYDAQKKAVGEPVTTGTDGKATWSHLVYGTYYVVETSAPVGYQLDSTWHEASVNQQTVLLPMRNTPVNGSIRVVKKAAGEERMLAGAQFELLVKTARGYERAKTGDVEEIPVLTTDANGMATWAGIDYGDYYVHEVVPPEGYQPNDEYVPISVRVQDALSYVSVSNEIIRGKLRIQKQDALTKEVLAGAAFTLTRLSVPASHNGAGVGEVVATLITDAAGVAEIDDLPWGRYLVTETKAPEHYEAPTFSTEVAITANEQVCELVVENEPTKGWLRLTKTDRLNGNPIAGVQFDIYEHDAYGDALVGSMVTDENGVAVSEPLRKGHYLVREHGATGGYVFEEVTLEATVKSDETTELQATNQLVQVRLKIYKWDAEEARKDNTILDTRGDGLLTGAEFRVLAGADITDRQGNVLYAKGDIVASSLITAGDEAAVMTEELWPGVYIIEEVAPPEGYLPSTKSINIDARDAAKQSEEAVVIYEGWVLNTIKYGAQAILKTLGSGSINPDPGYVEQPESGAEFDVYLLSAGSYENARECERDHLKTNKRGYAKTKALPYGIYVLQQTKGQPGYELKGPITFEINGEEDLANPPQMVLSDQPIRYRLRLIKLDSETGKVITLAGTSFKIKDAQGAYVTQKVYYPTAQEIDTFTFTTDASGTVLLPKTVTWGAYFIEEIQAPEGYLIREDDFAVFIGQDGDEPGNTYTVDIEIPDQPVKGRILLDKKGLQFVGAKTETDAWRNEVQRPIFEERYLAGAVFEVRAAEEIVGVDGTIWYQQDELVDTITTTANGADASVALPLGKYYLQEVAAPAGYVLDNQRHEVELAYADACTAQVDVPVEVGNEYLPIEVQLYKEKEVLQAVPLPDGQVRQEVVNVPGEGFVFGLYNAEDIPSEGDALLADTLVATAVTNSEGKLVFSGYFPHGAYYLRELSGPTGWKLSAGHIPVNLTADQLPPGATAIAIALEEPVHNELVYFHVTLTKTDITGQETVPGALIEVVDAAGAVIYRAYTDAQGQIPEIHVTPGTYTFREVLAPDGYLLNVSEMQFTVAEDGSLTGDTTLRDDFNRLLLHKADTTGNPLAGAVFALLDGSGREVLTAVSDENGLATFERIPCGKYILCELAAPAGFNCMADIEVEVTPDWAAPLELTCVDVPNHYEFQKVDPAGNPLAGVKFVLENADGTVLRELISDENGMVQIAGLLPGSYVVREAEALEGFVRTKETLTFTLDENYIVPETLPKLVNEPVIQTGVDFEMTPGLWISVGLIFAGLVLEVVTRWHKRKK